MDSLSGRYRQDNIDQWGKYNEPIEKVLNEDDWRLQEILNFRERINNATEQSQRLDKNAIYVELINQGITKVEDQISFLYKHGLSSIKIAEILKVKKNKVFKIIHLMPHPKRNTLTLKDVLAVIRSEKHG